MGFKALFGEGDAPWKKIFDAAEKAAYANRGGEAVGAEGHLQKSMSFDVASLVLI